MKKLVAKKPSDGAAARADVNSALELIANARDKIDVCIKKLGGDAGMTTRESYSYVVLRYIHDILTGEFVNVGLVMVVPGRSLILMKACKTFGRIKKIFPDFDDVSYKSAINAIERTMKTLDRDMKSEGMFKTEKTAGDYGRIALPLDDSSLQWSPVGVGLTADPQKNFDQLYDRFVTRYDCHQDCKKSDDDVWHPVEVKLKEQGVKVELAPKHIHGNTDTVEFRHAWKNGRWHACEPLSFDLSDSDNIKDKARRWLGHLSAVKLGATEDVQVHFIVGRPQNELLMPAYENALKILRQVPFSNKVFEENQIDEFVNLIQDEVRHHEGHA